MHIPGTTENDMCISVCGIQKQQGKSQCFCQTRCNSVYDSVSVTDKSATVCPCLWENEGQTESDWVSERWRKESFVLHLSAHSAAGPGMCRSQCDWPTSAGCAGLSVSLHLFHHIKHFNCSSGSQLHTVLYSLRWGQWMLMHTHASAQWHICEHVQM